MQVHYDAIFGTVVKKGTFFLEVGLRKWGWGVGRKASAHFPEHLINQVKLFSQTPWLYGHFLPRNNNLSIVIE